MTDLAGLSRTLFFPTTFVLYVAAMLAYLYRMAFTQVDRSAQQPARAAVAVGRAGTTLAVAGLVTHGASIVIRSVAAGGRVPWGNMFEFSSVMGFGVVLGALAVFHWRMRRPEVVGFLLLGAVLTMATAMTVYSEPGPLMPILDSGWLKIHVFAIMAAATVFTVGFVLTGLYLLRDRAEAKVAAARTRGMEGSTVGAAYAPGSVTGEADGEAADDTVPDRAGMDEPLPGGDDPRAYGRALRDAVNPVPLALATVAVGIAYGLLFDRVTVLVAAPAVAGVAVLVPWWFLPHLPSAATLDSLAYRTIAFGFPIWTFGVIAGAIWAEQSWGRYWGWDPKETSAFLTWVAYAVYLHARATRGWRGRKAAYLGLGAYGVFLFTYWVVNLVITGLHSYGGVPGS